MEATLIILLARTFYVLLIVVGAAIARTAVPIHARARTRFWPFATVGIPLIVLALWVPPRRSPRNLVLETLRISIPVSFAVAAIALPVYAAAFDAGGSVSETQSVLTTITVFCGLGLLPLIYPAEPEAGMSRERRALAVGPVGNHGRRSTSSSSRSRSRVTSIRWLRWRPRRSRSSSGSAWPGRWPSI